MSNWEETYKSVNHILIFISVIIILALIGFGVITVVSGFRQSCVILIPIIITLALWLWTFGHAQWAKSEIAEERRAINQKNINEFWDKMNSDSNKQDKDRDFYKEIRDEIASLRIEIHNRNSK